MNFGEGVQKISASLEPITYVHPVLSKNPIQKIEKIKSSFDQIFSHEKYNEIKDILSSKPENLQEYLSSKTTPRGNILDITV